MITNTDDRIREIAVEMCPDYPNVKECPIFECLWAIHESFKVTVEACNDWRKVATKLNGNTPLTVEQWHELLKD